MDDQKIREAFFKRYNVNMEKYNTDPLYHSALAQFEKTFYAGYKAAYSELKAENERMRCCGNCRYSGSYEKDWWPCETCNRCNGLGYKDNWEMKEGG